MNRMEFMQALRNELCDISPEEREAALQYYNDYLDDAGPENERQVLREWGSPQALARSIRSGMDNKPDNGEFTETGYSSAREEKQCPVNRRETQGGERGTSKRENRERCRINGWKWLAIALLCILLAPICVPAAVTLVAVIFGVLAGAAAVVLALFLIGIGLFAAGIAIAILGIVMAASTPPGAAVVFGAGLIATAFGAVITLLFGWLSVKCVTGVFKWLVELCRKPFHSKRKAGA